MRDEVSLPSVLLLFLLLVVTVATVGGLAPALAAALVGFLVVNRLFTPPLHDWTIAEAENLLALAIFLVVALVVSALVAAAARRTAEATRAAAEASTLASLAGTIASPDPLPVLVDHLQHAFGLTGAALLRKVDGAWQTEAAAGDAPTVARARPTRCGRSAGDLVLARAGQRPGGRGPPGAERLRRPAGRGHRPPPHRRPGRRGRGAGRGQRAAQRPAAGRLARPADAAGGDQGVGEQPPPARHRLVGRGPRRVPPHHRGRDRPARPRWS